MRRAPRPPDHRADREDFCRSTSAGASARRVSGNARPETEDRTGTASVRDRADDVQTRSGRPRPSELSVPEIRRDVRPLDGRELVSPARGQGCAEVNADRDDIAPGKLGVSEGAGSRNSRTGEPARLEHRRIPRCPQCDATNSERVLAVAPESR